MSVAMTRSYTGPSSVYQGTLGLSTNEVRPVRFHGLVRDHVYPLRLALQTLGELVWSDSSWMSDEDYDRYLEMVLDPVITRHENRCPSDLRCTKLGQKARPQNQPFPRAFRRGGQLAAIPRPGSPHATG